MVPMAISYRNRSQRLAVTLFADRLRGIFTAAKMLPLGNKRSGKPGTGEEGLGWQGRRRHNLSDQAPALGHINFLLRGPLDPASRLLMKPRMEIVFM